MTLSTREREVLDLEREWWRSAPTKKLAIRARLGCSPGTYYAVLRGLVGSAEAFRYDPLVVQRLRRRAADDRRARITGEGRQPLTRPTRPPSPIKSSSNRPPSSAQPSFHPSGAEPSLPQHQQ